MQIRIPHLVSRPARLGRTRYYWQPSATLRKAGWQTQILGHDLDAAMKAAAHWNSQVEKWRTGAADAATPRAARRQLQKYAAPATVRSLIVAFRKDAAQRVAASTLRTYGSALAAIDTWAGDQSPATITPERCRVLLASLATPAEPGAAPRLHRAAGVGRVLRTLFAWAVDNELVATNPMDRVTIRSAPPRQQIWPDHAIGAMVDMAEAMQLPSIATATLLAADTGQREADLLKLTWGKLATRNGRRTIRLRQGKTNVWIDVPLTERLATRLAQMETANRNRAIPSASVLTRESDGAAYQPTYFIRTFAAVRAAAIAGSAKHGLEPCPELEGLQYRDLRRTLIVRLAEADVDLPGIAAISGHKIETCKEILETYLPRTGKMAGAAIAKLEARRAAATPAAKAEQA